MSLQRFLNFHCYFKHILSESLQRHSRQSFEFEVWPVRPDRLTKFNNNKQKMDAAIDENGIELIVRAQ